jgi:hypothetical protein
MSSGPLLCACYSLSAADVGVVAPTGVVLYRLSYRPKPGGTRTRDPLINSDNRPVPAHIPHGLLETGRNCSAHDADTSTHFSETTGLGSGRAP